MQQSEHYMLRCFKLARLGAGKTSPNPIVGAVLVHNNTIIGEGFHRYYGGPHAEVEAIQSVSTVNQALIPYSTLYVSLEPCCIYGNTPPCTNLIIQHKIPNVIISCLDYNPNIAGKGVLQLKNAGINVIDGVLEKEGLELNKMRNTWVNTGLPYVVLKFALSKEDHLASDKNNQIWLSGWLAQRLTHKLRNRLDAILIGSKTLEIDNPALTTRFGFSNNPIIVILAPNTIVKKHFKIFESGSPIFIFSNFIPEIHYHHLVHINTLGIKEIIPFVLKTLGNQKITSLLVEGGAKVLQSFIKEKAYNEIRIFKTSKSIAAGKKINIPSDLEYSKEDLDDDELLVLHK